MKSALNPQNIDKYIQSSALEARSTLRKTRIVISEAVPTVRETISYKMPTFANDKGNLKFPIAEPFPYALVAEVARALSKQYQREKQ